MRVDGVGTIKVVQSSKNVDNSKKHCKICGRPIDKVYGCWCTGCVEKHRKTLEKGKGVQIDITI